MTMPDSLAWLREEPPEVLLRTVTGLVTGIRQVLVHPDLGNDGKLSAVSGLVDAAAGDRAGGTAGAVAQPACPVPA